MNVAIHIVYYVRKIKVGHIFQAKNVYTYTLCVAFHGIYGARLFLLFVTHNAHRRVPREKLSHPQLKWTALMLMKM